MHRCRLVVGEARVLRLDGQILIFEFEAPATGFLLPPDGTRVHVRFDSGIVTDARVLRWECRRRASRSVLL